MRRGYIYGKRDFEFQGIDELYVDAIGKRTQLNLLINSSKKNDFIVVKSLDHLADTIEGLTKLLKGLSAAKRWIFEASTGYSSKKAGITLDQIAACERMIKARKAEQTNLRFNLMRIKRRVRKISSDKKMISIKVGNNKSDAELGRIYNCSRSTIYRSKKRLEQYYIDRAS